MKSVEIMVREHDNILRMLKVIRKLCLNILDGKGVNVEAFEKVIDFVRNYADKHHHNKEEEVFFRKMADELGEVVAKGPIFGMFADHDLGRLFIKNLESAINKYKDGDMDSRIDIIGNAIAYADLLTRHIDKENNAIYKFGESRLSDEAKKEVEEKCEIIEKDAEGKGIQEKYLNLLEELEEFL